MRRALITLGAAAVVALGAGCATTGASSTGAASTAATPPAPVSKVDPWERWNRKVYAFNDQLDEAVVKPVAQAYQKVLPRIVRTGIDHFFSNIADAWSAANHYLQGKGQAGTEMGVRFAVNTFIGLGGVLDPASEMGLERRSEDFGQTLGVWGFGPGPYIVLPLLGSSNVRDATAFPVDRLVSASSLTGDTPSAIGVTTLEVVNTRAKLLSAGGLLDQVALDKYSFLRDAYLARRRSQLFDGNPPPEPEDADVPPPAAAPAASAAPAAPAASAPK